ncbi:hypothetical protein H7H82_17050 [Mycobacterium heidelbergense]|nr:hypothetical protein [Mycobacterium heidelbergense]
MAGIQPIEVLQQGIAVLVHRDPPRRHVVVNLPFTLLPALGPKPTLIGGNRQRWAQLEHTVVALGDLYLCTRFI